MLAFAFLNQSQYQQTNVCEQTIRVGSAVDAGVKSDSAYLQIEDPLVSPLQFTLNWDRGDRTQVELINHGRSLALSSGLRIHAGRTVQLELPVSFCVGDTQFQVHDADAIHPLDFGLATLSGHPSSEHARSNISPGPDTLAAWLDTLSELQRAVAGSQELFEIAARSVFNPGGLDGGLILRPNPTGWDVVARHVPYPDHGIGFREDLIQRAVADRETIFHDATLTDQNPEIEDLHSAVVCPVIGEHENVAAIIYGFRSLHRRNNRRGIRPLESQFVQVVADSLSAGLIRLRSEADASRTKVLLEHAFSPGIARQLQTNPSFLDGQTREVTVLFSDLRNFSEISERIGTTLTYALLTDVMDQFSNVISDLDGVVIDYYGDGLSAFWNAPFDQPQHAVLATQAAITMLECLPRLNATWSDRIGQELKLGIGVHTGIARVGNSGSRQRLKYGPCGTTVNLASRLENTTKQIGVPLVISGETAEKLQGIMTTQRIIRAALKGIQQPVEIHQPCLAPETDSELLRRTYAEALDAFEAGKLTDALSHLTRLKQEPSGHANPLVEFLTQVILTQRLQGSDGLVKIPAP